MRPDGVRAAAQHSLHMPEWACDGTDLQRLIYCSARHTPRKLWRAEPITGQRAPRLVRPLPESCGGQEGAPLRRMCSDGRGDRADGGVLLDVVHPVVVAKVSLRGAGKAKNRGGEAASDDAGKSELLHFGSHDLFPFLWCSLVLIPVD